MEAARPAGPDDLDALARLAAEAVAELEPTRGGAVWARREARPAPYADSLAAALDDDGQLVLAGTVHETVVGYAVAHLETLRDDSLLAVIDDLYVDPEARGIGVGEAMMDLILEWAASRGCTGIDGLALPGHRDTKNFFETFGLTARAIVVHRSLGEATAAPPPTAGDPRAGPPGSR